MTILASEPFALLTQMLSTSCFEGAMKASLVPSGEICRQSGGHSKYAMNYEMKAAAKGSGSEHLRFVFLRVPK